jgi:hypothetical protein
MEYLNLDTQLLSASTNSRGPRIRTEPIDNDAHLNTSQDRLMERAQDTIAEAVRREYISLHQYRAARVLDLRFQGIKESVSIVEGNGSLPLRPPFVIIVPPLKRVFHRLSHT